MESGRVDITQILKDTASQIDNGYFTSHSRFSYEGAMRAIDILDPKVDSGIGIRSDLSVSERVRQRIIVFGK